VWKEVENETDKARMAKAEKKKEEKEKKKNLEN